MLTENMVLSLPGEASGQLHLELPTAVEVVRRGAEGQRAAASVAAQERDAAKCLLTLCTVALGIWDIPPHGPPASLSLSLPSVQHPAATRIF